MRIARVVLLLALVGAAGSIALWMGKREEPPLPPDPLRDLAAEFLGVDPAELTAEGPPHELSGPFRHRPVSSVTYSTRDSATAVGGSSLTAWAEVVQDPPMVVLARWPRPDPEVEGAGAGRIAPDQLQAMGEEFLRARVPLFGEDDEPGTPTTRPSGNPPVTHFAWTGPGPDDLIHTVHLTLSQVDGAPCRFSVRMRPPAPPPATPIEISAAEAEELARQVAIERFGDKQFLVQPVETDSPFAPAGEPVYPVVVYVAPLSPEMFGVHATTGEVLEVRLPPF